MATFWFGKICKVLRKQVTWPKGPCHSGGHHFGGLLRPGCEEICWSQKPFAIYSHLAEVTFARCTNHIHLFSLLTSLTLFVQYLQQHRTREYISQLLHSPCCVTFLWWNMCFFVFLTLFWELWSMGQWRTYSIFASKAMKRWLSTALLKQCFDMGLPNPQHFRSSLQILTSSCLAKLFQTAFRDNLVAYFVVFGWLGVGLMSVPFLPSFNSGSRKLVRLRQWRTGLWW